MLGGLFQINCCPAKHNERYARYSPRTLPSSHCLPAPVEDGWMETCGGLFILHKCCPKYCSCKHIMIAAAAAADRNLMIVLNGTRPWPCLGKYLFKIPHATAHMKRKRERSRESLPPWGKCPLLLRPHDEDHQRNQRSIREAKAMLLGCCSCSPNMLSAEFVLPHVAVVAVAVSL